jgi:MFS family permease
MLGRHALTSHPLSTPISAKAAFARERSIVVAAEDGGSDVTEEQHWTGLRAYGKLLRHGPASRPFLFAALARLTLAMIPLGILILVEHERQQYAVAGMVSGAYAIGAAFGTPVWGRLMDHFGQIRVLLPTAATSAALLVGLALTTTWGAPDYALITLAAGVGLSYPAISPALRSSFRIVLPDPAARRVAFALDATSVELAFVCGPLLLSALLLPGMPLLPLLVTAGLLAAGGLGYCGTAVARRASPAVQRAASGHNPRSTAMGGRTALASTGVVAVLAVMLMLSVGFGQLDTSLAATSDQELGGSEQVGILFAAIAGGSTVGGLAFGARSWRHDERRAVAVLLCLFGLLLASLAGLLSVGVVSLLILLPVLFLTGLTIAPTLIMQQSRLDHLAPPDRLNEAQAFLSASNTTGAAVGTAIAGIVIDIGGVPWSFVGAALGVLAAAGVALLNRRAERSRAANLDQPAEPGSAATAVSRVAQSAK